MIMYSIATHSSCLVIYLSIIALTFGLSSCPHYIYIYTNTSIREKVLGEGKSGPLLGLLKGEYG